MDELVHRHFLNAERCVLVEAIFLYGSVARGEADEESDIDLLVLTSKKVSRPERHQITDLVCEVNLEEDTNFSTMVVDRISWESGIFSALPIHEQILIPVSSELTCQRRSRLK